MPDPQAQTRPATWDDIIRDEAKKAGVPASLALAVAQTESSKRIAPPPSSAGAIGIMQLMPETAKRLGVDPNDPVQNIHGGVAELRRLLDEHQGNLELVLRRYNGSPQAPTSATDPYIQSVAAGIHRQPAGGQPASFVGQSPEEAANWTPRPIPAWRPQALPKYGASSLYAPPKTPAEVAQRRASGARMIPPPPDQPLTWGQTAADLGYSTAEQFDPRTRAGLRNFGGAAGATAAGAAYAASAPVSVPATALGIGVAGVIGAFGGGALAEAGTQAVGQAPPSTLGILGAGGEQAAYETIGHAVVWPFRVLGRGVMASSVGRGAHEYLQAARSAITDKFASAVEHATDTVHSATRAAQQTLRLAKREAVRTYSQPAKASAKASVDAATAGAEAATTAAARPFSNLVGARPSTEAAGAEAGGVMHGPSRTAYDILGKNVEKAAVSGPPIPTEDVHAAQQEIQDVVEKLVIPARRFPQAPVHETAGQGVAFAAEGTAQAALEQRAASGDREAGAILQAMGKQAVLDALTKGEADTAAESLKHPAMPILRGILQADPTKVTFEEAWRWKSQLDHALGYKGVFGRPVNTEVDNLTKKVAGLLDGMLRAQHHLPYEEAAAQYKKFAPTMTEEYADTLWKEARGNPARIVHTLDEKNPTSIRMLHEMLVDLPGTHPDPATAAAGAARGQAAFDGVRSAYVHQRILSQGIDKLGSALDKLETQHWEFADELFGGPSGQTMRSNLHQIADSYKIAQDAGAFAIARAKITGEQAVATAKLIAQSGIDQAEAAGTAGIDAAKVALAQTKKAKRIGLKPTAEEHAFQTSSLIKRLTPVQYGGNLARFILLGPGQIWGSMSGIQLILNSPREADLLRWVSHSPAATQTWVKLMSGGRGAAPAFALGDLQRVLGWLQMFGPEPTAQSQTVTRSPVPARTAVKKPASPIGTPPSSVPQAAPR